MSNTPIQITGCMPCDFPSFFNSISVISERLGPGRIAQSGDRSTGDNIISRIKIIVLSNVGCVDGVQRVCAQIVVILHIETFVTFDYDPN